MVDRIFVSDKEQSSYMKSYAEQMDAKAKYAEKPWGTYSVIDAHDTCTTIKVFLNTGHQMKYYSHMRRDEVWTIVSGTGMVIFDDQRFKVQAQDVAKLPRGCKHTIIAETTLNIIEVQIGEDINVKDKVV